MSKFIVEAITEYYGERCPDYDEDCFCCKAWSEYDTLTSPARCDELVTTSSINGTLLVTRQNAEEVIENLKNEVAVKDKLIQSLIDFDSEEVKRLEADNAAKEADFKKLEDAWYEAEGKISDLEAKLLAAEKFIQFCVDGFFVTDDELRGIAHAVRGGKPS